MVDGAIDEIVAFDLDHHRAVPAAWRRFGTGRHPASLNLGDCLAYAAARSMDAPLLFEGDDFGPTDVVAVRY